MRRTLKISFLNSFQIYSTVLLTLVTMLYVTSPELISLLTGSLYLWPPSPISPIPHPLPLATTVCSLYLCVCLSVFKDSQSSRLYCSWQAVWCHPYLCFSINDSFFFRLLLRFFFIYYAFKQFYCNVFWFKFLSISWALVSFLWNSELIVFIVTGNFSVLTLSRYFFLSPFSIPLGTPITHIFGPSKSPVAH